ncbi:CHAT domain-containing protein [Cupriavidus sp. CuC1]|uniref:CHAT domain-containing protein n=1 Tax=Cupriavidus sp. CuC1 TaxID=3373131 RepID=UPI0037D09A8A
MKGYSELEIVIQRDALQGFQASARQRLDEGDNITPFTRVTLDVKDARLFSGDPLISGRVLSDALLTPNELRDAFVAARTRSAERGLSLRIRLRVDPSASVLHSLPWETIVDPEDQTTSLLRNGLCIFSRYLFTREFRLPRLRAKQGIQALVVVASPQDLSGEFAHIDVAREIGVAQNALHPLPARTLAGRGTPTLQAIVDGVRDGADILYMVCHGALGPKGAALWLEDESGNGALVTGEEFAARIGAHERTPSLIVLCSCQSAGVGTPARDSLTALGPMLAKEGVPAVLAMQGKLSMATAGQFMPAFFKQLANHGEVDRAVAAARAQLMNHPDWWMPVVFTRLDSARIWYPPGFGSSEDSLDPWDSIVSNLKAGACTPILGPTMNESLFGSRRELASLWGETYRYPMSGRDIEDLPQVAQYLAVTRQGAYPRRELYKNVYRRILDKYPADVPEALRDLDEMGVIEKLGSLVSEVGRKIRSRDPVDPHTVLASYKLPVYVTTDPSDLLVDALKEQGVAPRVRLLRWNDAAERCDDQYVGDAPAAAPAKATREWPIVVKLFGDLSEPASLVITEDQFFDYLTKAASTKDTVPPAVRFRLSDSALLFVGFQADSWDFRVLFRSLLQLEGKDLRADYEHFSVQIDPNSILDPGSARRYIEKYLQAKAKLRLYWGDVPTFISELRARTQGMHP